MISLKVFGPKRSYPFVHSIYRHNMLTYNGFQHLIGHQVNSGDGFHFLFLYLEQKFKRILALES